MAERSSPHQNDVRPRAGAQLSALLAVASAPLIAAVLAVGTWKAGVDAAGAISRAPSIELAPVKLGEILTVVAGAAGTVAAVHLSLMTALLLATPQHSRLRRTADRLTPPSWRRIVAVATAGLVSVGLALPAAASPETSNAGWVPEPVTDSHAASPHLGSIRGAQVAVPEVAQGTPPEQGGSTRAEGYVVGSGDSLWSITAKEWSTGDGVDDTAIAQLWPELYEANRDTIGENPSLIHPGQRLAIPEGWGR